MFNNSNERTSLPSVSNGQEVSSGKDGSDSISEERMILSNKEAGIRMMVEDVYMMLDLITSDPEELDVFQKVNKEFLVQHHLARVIHEAIRASKALFDELSYSQNFHSAEVEGITAQVRNRSKMLDNLPGGKAKEIENVIALCRHMEEALMGIRARDSKLLQPLNLLEDTNTADICIYSIDGSVVNSTTSIAYKFGIDTADESSIMDKQVLKSWKNSLIEILKAAKETGVEQRASLGGLRCGEIETMDFVADEYLLDRYNADATLGTKLLILSIEGELNAARLYFSKVKSGHRNSLFRCKFAILYHSLKSLQVIQSLSAQPSAGCTDRLWSELNKELYIPILSKEGKELRNRCYHYHIGGVERALNLEKGFFGMVEAVYHNIDFAHLEAIVDEAYERICSFLRDWASP